MRKTTADYLDAIKAKCDLTSDYAVAMKIGTTRNAVSHYRHCKNAFDNYTCLKVAKILEIPLAQVIADMELQREKDEKKREEWLGFELRLKGAAAAVIAAAGVTLVVQPTPANASESTAYDISINQPTNYPH